MSDSFSLDSTHGLSTGLITMATAKGWSMWNGSDVALQPMVEAGVACGASAVVVDSVLKDQDLMVKAVATGAVLAGAMMAWKNDQHFQVWVPVGAVSYWLSDMAMKAYADANSKSKMGRNGHGRRDKTASDGTPVVPGM